MSKNFIVLWSDSKSVSRIKVFKSYLKALQFKRSLLNCCGCFDIELVCR